ncbi:MAG: mandelate racemase/muconate lactonizing enzyme family protein, partial [Nitrospirales bacterium]
ILEIPFRQAFAHATATRSGTEGLLVKALTSEGGVGMGEGCPRFYVTGETLATSQVFFEAHRTTWEQFKNLEDMTNWMTANVQQLDANPAAWCAVELALLDVWGKESGQTVETVLGVPELREPFQYSAVLGTDSLTVFHKQATQFSALGFSDFKIKVSGRLNEDRQKIEMLNGLSLEKMRIRLDANNLWKHPDEAMEYLEALRYAIWAVEEPLQVNDYEGCRTINRKSGLAIILDESFLREEQFQSVQADPQTWIINIRISKMGGIQRALTVARQARVAKIPIIIGAQVGETSILTRAALTVANQYRDILLAQEGAFGTYLLEHDITDTPLMFGKGGKLDPQSLLDRPGLGLTFSKSSETFPPIFC